MATHREATGTAGQSPPANSSGDRERVPVSTLALSWADEDFENRFRLFRAGRFTGVNNVLSFLAAVIITGIFFFVLVAGQNLLPALRTIALPLIRPGNVWTTVPAILFFFWCIATLFIKQRKIAFQEKALDLAAVPQQPDFVLNEATARAVLERLYNLVDHPRHFLLLNRIERALSNLQNIGGLSDVSSILKAQAENDESQIASSYTLVSGLVWAIPVLGFIGTVQGLSVAIGRFTGTLQATGDLDAIKASLQGVTGGLATAFETTLVALVCALIIQLYTTFLQQKETDFLDACNDYCHTQVISRLRLHRDDPRLEVSEG